MSHSLPSQVLRPLRPAPGTEEQEGCSDEAPPPAREFVSGRAPGPATYSVKNLERCVASCVLLFLRPTQKIRPLRPPAPGTEEQEACSGDARLCPLASGTEEEDVCSGDARPPGRELVFGRAPVKPLQPEPNNVQVANVPTNPAKRSVRAFSGQHDAAPLEEGSSRRQRILGACVRVGREDDGVRLRGMGSARVGHEGQRRRLVLSVPDARHRRIFEAPQVRGSAHVQAERAHRRALQGPAVGPFRPVEVSG